MARRDPHRRGRATPQGTRPRSFTPNRGTPPPLALEAAELLAEDSPMPLMLFASSLIEATTPRPLDRFPGNEVERPDQAEVLLSFVESGWPALSALTLAISTMLPDPSLADRLRRGSQNVLSSSHESMPTWLAAMGDITIADITTMPDPLGDGENVMISWVWPGVAAATAVSYVDHNMGTIVKDAFVVDEALPSLLQLYASVDRRKPKTKKISAAVARARLEQAIAQGERTLTPLDDDSWPGCRPLLEWVLGQLPEGGKGYVRPRWSSAKRDALVDEFVASSFGQVAGLDADEVADLVHPMIWFACDYGPGDPLRWSPVSVEILLSDWYQRKVVGLPAKFMRRVPDVLEAFVLFSHERKSIDRSLTRDTVGAVHDWGAGFAGGSRAAAIGSEDLFGPDLSEPELTDAEYVEAAVDLLESAITEVAGGAEVLAALDEQPLPDRDFDWSVVPATLREPTARTLEQLDAWAVTLFDAEVRTIARAVLAAVVSVDPGVFKRSARTDSLAAAILAYLQSSIPARLDRDERQQLVWSARNQSVLAAATGVSASSLSSRSKTVANVLDRAPIDWPRFLHSVQRAELIAARDLIATHRSRS